MRQILEYLGGIETNFAANRATTIARILEYLGGIETDTNGHCPCGKD